MLDCLASSHHLVVVIAELSLHAGKAVVYLAKLFLMPLLFHLVGHRLRAQVPLVRVQSVVDVGSVHFTQRFVILLDVSLDVLLDLTELALHPQRLVLD